MAVKNLSSTYVKWRNKKSCQWSKIQDNNNEQSFENVWSLLTKPNPWLTWFLVPKKLRVNRILEVEIFSIKSLRNFPKRNKIFKNLYAGTDENVSFSQSYEKKSREISVHSKFSYSWNPKQLCLSKSTKTNPVFGANPNIARWVFSIITIEINGYEFKSKLTKILVLNFDKTQL